MLLKDCALVAVLILAKSAISTAYRNSSEDNLLSLGFFPSEDRPPNCPPCFNCNLESFKCAQFATCNKYNGKCACPPGFGGDDCAQPVCGSLAQGKNRAPRANGDCECAEGWQGINCNVCETDQACNSLMPEDSGGVCYADGVLVKENHQMCDVTNRKILDQLKERKPQVTFSCSRAEDICNFQCGFSQVLSFSPS